MKSSLPRVERALLALLTLALSPMIQAQDVVFKEDPSTLAYGQATIPEMAWLKKHLDGAVGPGTKFDHLLVVHFDGHYKTSPQYQNEPRKAQAELPRDKAIDYRLKTAEKNLRFAIELAKAGLMDRSMTQAQADALVGEVRKSLEEARKKPPLTLAKKNAFARFKLERALLPESYDFNEASPRFLGTIEFRYYDQDRAPHTLAALYDCKSERGRKKLERTYIVGTGNSHGAHALDVFAQRLKKVCGKEVDLAFFGDAVAQPFWKGKTSLKAKFLSGRCHAFYQRESKIINGAPIKGCKNYLIERDDKEGGISGFIVANHEPVASIPRYLVDVALIGYK